MDRMSTESTINASKIEEDSRNSDVNSLGTDRGTKGASGGCPTEDLKEPRSGKSSTKSNATKCTVSTATPTSADAQTVRLSTMAQPDQGLQKSKQPAQDRAHNAQRMNKPLIPRLKPITIKPKTAKTKPTVVRTGSRESLTSSAVAQAAPKAPRPKVHLNLKRNNSKSKIPPPPTRTSGALRNSLKTLQKAYSIKVMDL